MSVGRTRAAMSTVAMIAVTTFSQAWQTSAAQAQSVLPNSASVEQMIREFSADRQTIDGRYRIKLESVAIEKRKQLYEQWLERLLSVDFSSLDRVGQLDYLLLK